MTRRRSWLGTERPRWEVIAMGVLLLVAAALLIPYLPLLRATPFPVLLVVGLVGYYLRRRVLDALLLVAAHGLAEFYGEPFVDANALALLTLAVLAPSGRPRFALFTGIALFSLFLGSAQLKLRFAGSALTWQDLRYFFLQFSDNIGVAFSQPTLLMVAGAAIAAFAVAAVLVWRLDGAVPYAALRARGQLRRHWASRGLAAAMALWCAAELWGLAKADSQRPPWHFAERPRKTPVSTFLSTLHLQAVPQYQKVDTAAFARDVQALPRGAAPAGPADIVVFLQESQFNPLAVRACPPSLCRSPLFESHGDTTDDGELRVHVFGGGTWLSEFTLATGLPHTLFGHAGAYASFNVAPSVNRSLVRSLKAAGYHTVAVYPVRGGMMNARLAYRSYGFDEFLDAEALGLPGNFETPDSEVHAAAMRALQSARQHGKPVFLLALTIFNHGEHGLRNKPVPQQLKADARRVLQPDAAADNLADYLWRTQGFQQAYDRTRAAVLEGPRPAVLAWFGDHQPPFAMAPALLDRIHAAPGDPPIPDRFVTWFHIASNRGQPAAVYRRHRLDLAFLPGLLAQRAGAALDDWLAANVVARERCGGLLIECSDAHWLNAYYTYLLDDLGAIR